MTYVISDLHGRSDLFRRLREQIGFGPEDELYILGDVTDRNPGGVEILKEIMSAPNIRMLLGNHDHMLRRALAAPEKLSLNGYETNLELWYRNGGRVTHEELLAEPEKSRREILRFLEELPLNIALTVDRLRILLCHASPASLFGTYPAPALRTETDFAVWNRLDPEREFTFDADLLVCGHTPTAYYQDVYPMELCWLREDVVDIDCGCAAGETAGGRLGCLRLEDGEEFYAQ